MNPEQLKKLVEDVKDQDSLLTLLRDGLGWDLRPEFTLDDSPEIAQGVKGTPCEVFQLVGAFANRLAFVVEFKGEYVRRDLRELLTSLRKLIRETGKFDGIDGHGDTVFIVTTPEYEDIRFVLFEHQEKRLPKIRSFGWRKKFAGRTVLTHNLEYLKWGNQPLWHNAWDVEGLTETFYQDLKDTVDAIKAVATHPGGEKARDSYVQQLINRLLFIAFIERFEWLRTPSGSSDYLHDQWNRYQDRSNYKDVAPDQIPATFLGLLGRVFFDALDHPDGVSDDPVLGTVPYLNGGLFSEEADLDVGGVTVEDRAFRLLFDAGTGLFRRYNFTVTESTPLDQEVAVDPEMLGKIFERLIIAEERHGTGTYYTPRPIVEFMVNEALKGYLVDRGLPREKAELLLDHDTVQREGLAFLPDEMQKTMDWLFEVRAVDPACGSGAYLLMLLQRLFDLVDRLEVSYRRQRGEQSYLYDTKLRLLKNCIYGVDLHPTAVRIARLRLWLSLVVENSGEKPEPLPSFDFLIMEGDALSSPVGLGKGGMFFDKLVRDYAAKKRQYFHPKPGQRRPTKDEMIAARLEIAHELESELNSRLHAASPNPFDWEIDFAEVFHPEDDITTIAGTLNLSDQLPTAAARAAGFDIVVANPPYVNSGELLRNMGRTYKDALVQAYPRTATGTADLLVYFMERAVELLRPGGQFAFITSNKWLKAQYGAKVRGFMAARTHVHHLIDFRDLPVFQGTIAYPLITLATKRKEGDTAETIARFTAVTSLNPPYPDLPTIIQEWGGDLPAGSLGKEGTWRLESGAGADRLAKMRERGIPLGEYVQGRIYRGVLTGLNEVKIGSDGKMYGKSVPPGVRVVRKEGVFVIDGVKRAELIAEDPKSAEIIKPLAVGRDIKRWVVEDNDRWLIVTKIGVDMTRYPAVMRHLARFEERLRPRADQGSEWWELRACAYYSAFDEPKIVWGNLNDRATYGYSPAGTMVNAPAVFIPTSDMFLIGLLNSQTGWELLTEKAYSRGGGFFETKPMFVEQIPIPDVPAKERDVISELVAKILARKTEDLEADVSELEAEINRRVEYLYFGEGDSYDDAVKKDGDEIRTLLRRPTEDTTLEFKETLWHDVRLGSVHGDRVLDVMKAICAMLNRDGGTILIGVTDDKQIMGIDRDLEKLETVDRFQRKLQEAFGVKLRPDPSDLVRIRFIPFDGKTIARVDIKSDPCTMFTLDDKVYLRRDGASVELNSVATAHWWQRRQRGEDGS